MDGGWALGLALSSGMVRGATHRGEGIVQIVDGPGDDDNVVDVQPEGQHSSGKTHPWEWTHHHNIHSVTVTTSVQSLYHFSHLQSYLTLERGQNLTTVTYIWQEREPGLVSGAWLRLATGGAGAGLARPARLPRAHLSATRPEQAGEANRTRPLPGR